MSAVEVVSSAAELDAEVRAALRRQIVTLADSKRLLGLRYSDWLLGAPSIESGIAASGMAQDEWGHARLLYAMLKDFGEDPQTLEHERDPAEYASVDVLDRPFDDWADVVAAMVLVDGALTVALEGLAGGGYEPARARVPKMVSEEAFHADLGAAWARRLAGGTDGARARLAEALEAFAPRTLAWLAPNDETHDALVAAGLQRDGAALRSTLLERVAASLTAAGVATDPAPRFDGWDADRGRGPGAPDAEAIERARGDRNRALFVE